MLDEKAESFSTELWFWLEGVSGIIGDDGRLCVFMFVNLEALFMKLVGVKAGILFFCCLPGMLNVFMLALLKAAELFTIDMGSRTPPRNDVGLSVSIIPVVGRGT